MRFLAKATASNIVVACALLAASPARAAGDVAVEPQPPATASPVVSMDAAVKSALAGIATLLLADLAGRMASGSMDSFDPGPALQRSMQALLESGAADRLINGALTQALGSSSEGSAGLPPELRSMLAVAARAAVATARREISRELAAP